MFYLFLDQKNIQREEERKRGREEERKRERKKGETKAFLLGVKPKKGYISLYSFLFFTKNISSLY